MEVRHPPSIVVTRSRAVALAVIGYAIVGVTGWALFMHLESSLGIDPVRDRRAEQSTQILVAVLVVLLLESLYRILRRPAELKASRRLFPRRRPDQPQAWRRRATTERRGDHGED